MRSKGSTLYVDRVLVTGASSWTGGGDLRNASSTEWAGCKFAGNGSIRSWGILIRIGYHLFSYGCVIDNYEWGLRVDNQGHLQIWEGAAPQKQETFIRNCTAGAGIGIYLLNGSGCMDGTTLVTYSGNTTNNSTDVNSWIS